MNASSGNCRISVGPPWLSHVSCRPMAFPGRFPIVRCSFSVTRKFAGHLKEILTLPGRNTDLMGKTKVPCNQVVTRVLQAFRPITDSPGKEYRRPREVLLTTSGSSLLRGWPVLGQISAKDSNSTCKTTLFVQILPSVVRPSRTSGQYRRPREEILMASGSFTDAPGKECRRPREVLVTASGRNTDDLGKFISIISCKTGILVLRFRFPCMYECMYCSCCLTGKPQTLGGYFVERA